MATYSYAQLEELWISNGGSRATAPLAAAIAMAESSGESAVTSPNPDGGTNVGPWQLDTRGVGAGYSVQQLQDANTNARLAVKGSQDGRNWSDWATFASGAYKQFLKGGVPPSAGGVQTTAASGGVGGLYQVFDPLPWLPVGLPFLAGTAAGIADVGTGIAQVSSDLQRLVGWISWLFVPSHWMRIICFILGVPAVGLGLVTMVKGSQPIPISAYGVSTEISGGSIAPAIGIIEVTAGAILLFLAFHNLPDSVQTFPQLLSHIQGQVAAGAASKEGPGPKAPVI